MSTMLINDLSVAEELDAKAMARIRGGCGFCALATVMPQFSSTMPNFSFDPAQAMNQSQNVVTNNGNNAAFVGEPAAIPGQSPGVKTNAVKF